VPPPTNARNLKPADIDLVIALGDSLTAAFGADASSIFDLFVDYRASSFSGGVNPNLNTFPKLLTVFNNGLTGFSIGDGDEYSSNSRLNVAVTGAISEELPPQITNLRSKLDTLNRPNDWKHISLFIGGNDLCDSCDDPPRFSAAQYSINIQRALDEIKGTLRNVFVSLVVPPDVTLLSELTGGLCSILRPFECTCVDPDDGAHELHAEYVTALHEIENLPKYNDRADFYVVVQPFLELINIPRLPNGNPDMSYFAPDCFHFSDKAHTEAGLALWNNLMEPRASKKREWTVGEPYECPGPNQFLQ